MFPFFLLKSVFNDDLTSQLLYHGFVFLLKPLVFNRKNSFKQLCFYGFMAETGLKRWEEFSYKVVVLTKKEASRHSLSEGSNLNLITLVRKDSYQTTNIMIILLYTIFLKKGVVNSYFSAY